MREYYKVIAGVDEAGRGPLVGSVVAAAVILDDNHGIVGLADSKILTEKKREKLFDEIIKRSRSYAIAEATAEEIDTLNILQASLLAMKRAVERLKVQPDFVQVDGNRCPEWHYASEAIIKGDSKVQAISAASILAKVHRDRLMVEFDQKFPQYQFAKHKGYPTKLHFELLERHGVIDGYRKTFKPVARLLA
jgi:ribonuclease HII